MATLPEIATEIVNKTIIKLNEDCSRTIFLVGRKSTLLHHFLDKNDTPKETLVLEYSFGRKSTTKQSLEKTICHFWEYGGKLELLRNVLTSVPIHSKNFFVVMIDLSKLKAIWNTLQTCVDGLNGYSSRSHSWELIIIGGKYDIFKNYGATVITKNKGGAAWCGVWEWFRKKEKNLNYNKPMAIPKGFDSWESIGVPAATIEQVKIRHVTRIPLEVETKETVSSELQRNHPEPILDSLVALKYEELRNLDSYDPSLNEYLMCL